MYICIHIYTCIYKQFQMYICVYTCQCLACMHWCAPFISHPSPHRNPRQHQKDVLVILLLAILERRGLALPTVRHVYHPSRWPPESPTCLSSHQVFCYLRFRALSLPVCRPRVQLLLRLNACMHCCFCRFGSRPSDPSSWLHPAIQGFAIHPESCWLAGCSWLCPSASGNLGCPEFHSSLLLSQNFT